MNTVRIINGEKFVWSNSRWTKIVQEFAIPFGGGRKP